MEKKRLYEVETRVYFNSQEEAFERLPFLKDCLTTKVEWETSMYGLEIYNSGKLLRISEVTVSGNTRAYWGYKEEDLGKFYNIRKELDEEITHGIKGSYILELINGKEEEVNKDNVEQILESLGHKKFMSFTGRNLTGRHEKLQIDLKLLFCPILRYPLLLEIEKSAETLEEAYTKELELRDFLCQYKLENRALKEEPTTLLYETLKR
jgi:adenylate cyclase class IV